MRSRVQSPVPLQFHKKAFRFWLGCLFYLCLWRMGWFGARLTGAHPIFSGGKNSYASILASLKGRNKEMEASVWGWNLKRLQGWSCFLLIEWFSFIGIWWKSRKIFFLFIVFCNFAACSNRTEYEIGALAHLARAFDWQSRGGEFESRMLHNYSSDYSRSNKGL